MFVELLARFRALSLYYQFAHWSAKGSWFYQDHLFFERLYNDVNDELDGIAEKGIGVTGSNAHVLLVPHLARVSELVGAGPAEAASNAEFFAALLAMEQELTVFLTGAYDELVTTKRWIGIQDLLAALANSGTQRVYLVQARLQAYANEVTEDAD